MPKYNAGPKKNNGTVQAFPLGEWEKQRPDMRRLFRSAAQAFANRLARSSKGDKEKNIDLANALYALIARPNQQDPHLAVAHYDVFSLVDPAEDIKRACRPKKIIFKLRAHHHRDEEQATWRYDGDGSVTIPAPQKKLSLPQDDAGNSYIPAGSAVRITLPFRPENMPGGTAAEKSLADIAHRGKTGGNPPRNAKPPAPGPERRHKNKTPRLCRRNGQTACTTR